jgi:glycine/D-amino acid oxidase-like deaminating enzyme
MNTTAEVVIIGAGVIGCSTAYHLAKKGLTDVVVVEMEQVGSGSSSKSASMLSLQFGRDALMARLAKYSYERYMHFEEELGTSIDFRRTGWITLAGEAEADSLRQTAATLQALGIQSDLLTPEEVRVRYPELNIYGVTLGAWGPDDGPFDPHMILWGYMKQATARGVRLRQGERATGLCLGNGRLQGVETTQGCIAAKTVINAAGPWAAEVCAWAGVDLPLRNSVRTIVMTGPLAEIPSDRPFVEDETAGWYFRPETGGVIMGMGAVPARTPEASLDTEMVNAIIDFAVRRVPVLEKASLLTAWSGVRPLTEDNRPILGDVPGLDGFLLNAGWGGVGIIQAPVAGQLLAELVCDGQTSTFGIRDFMLDRFQTVRL